MQEMDIDHGYDNISDEDLNALVQQYLQENPGGGHAYIIGCLHAAHSLCIGGDARAGWSKEKTYTL